MSRIDWWNIFFLLLFVLCALVGFRLVENAHAIVTLTLWEATLLSLAAFRLTRLTVYDSITRWFRDLFENGQPYTFTGTVRTLVHCPWCTGLWFALVLLTAHFAFPWSRFFILILALGGVASLMQVGANLLGWSAEKKKRDTVGTPGASGGTCG